jgi:hypothetical protein
MSEQSKQTRAPADQRAGTKLGPRSTPVTVEWPEQSGQYKVMGYIDPDAGVFQGGGEYSEIFNINVNPHQMSMPLPCWQRLGHRAVVTRWEMIQHDDNTVWAIDMALAAENQIVYRTREGVRIGVSKNWVSHIDAAGATIGKSQSVKGLDWESLDPKKYTLGKRGRK